MASEVRLSDLTQINDFLPLSGWFKKPISILVALKQA